MNFKEWWFTSLRPLLVKGSRAAAAPVESFAGNRQDGAESLLHPSIDKGAEEARKAEAAAQLKMAGAASQARVDVKQLSAALTRACRETDPEFMRLGQDLQEIYGAAMGLTNSVQQAASHLSQGAEGMTCLDRAGFLVENAWKSLTGEQENIEKGLDHVRKLLDHLEKFSLVCDRINRIGLWFRVVGVNIEIECNVQHLSGDMFAGVSKEVNVLSGQINQMVAGMKNGLVTAISGLSTLEGSSSRSLAEIGQMAEKAQGIVRSSYDNIQEILAETVTLIDTATTRARIIGAKAGDVVVGIQFHDSMSQRIEHIVEAMEDITGLCETSGKVETGETAQTLGSVYFILDLQKKQLHNLREEIRELALTTQDSFQIINGEIVDMRGELAGSRLTGNCRNGSGADCFKPLQQGLLNLGKLLTTGNTMNDALHQSTEEIASVADQLLGMIVGVRNIKEETHIKAINTIIMANHLGSQGMTIEVLAKEIRSLADQTGELAAEVSTIQADIVEEVAALRATVAEESATITVPELEDGIAGMGVSFQQVQEQMGGVTQNTAAIAQQIGGVAARLSFLENLGCKMEESISQVEQILTDLEPWRDSGQVHDENILRLLSRYTMDQERLVHLPMDGSQQAVAADNDFELFSSDGAEEQGTADVTLFDDNVELF
ncbi:MAG: hypothetical protein J0652_09380 [Desulfobulbaceae bacterium]|nr:hypothetical protein [Desulfobulbaceae bacterium]